jgi:hypothetical protein
MKSEIIMKHSENSWIFAPRSVHSTCRKARVRWNKKKSLIFDHRIVHSVCSKAQGFQKHSWCLFDDLWVLHLAQISLCWRDVQRNSNSIRNAARGWKCVTVMLSDYWHISNQDNEALLHNSQPIENFFLSQACVSSKCVKWVWRCSLEKLIVCPHVGKLRFGDKR